VISRRWCRTRSILLFVCLTFYCKEDWTRNRLAHRRADIAEAGVPDYESVNWWGVGARRNAGRPSSKRCTRTIA